RAPGASQLFPLASSLPWIAKGGTLNRPAEALVAIPDPGRHYSVPVGGIISLWWAASFRYGGRHHLVMMGGLDRNQHPRFQTGSKIGEKRREPGIGPGNSCPYQARVFYGYRLLRHSQEIS